MKYNTIIFSVEEGIAWIRFNRPKKLNAMNPEVVKEIDDALIECARNEEIKAVILTGSEKAFMSGADVEAMSTSNVNEAYLSSELTMGMQDRLSDLPKPTIAAISGYALGGGLEIALCCDFRIAAENAVLGLPEITLGIIPGGGGTQRLPRLIGLAHASELLMFGSPIKAEKVLAVGLVNEVVPVDQLEAKAVDYAKRLIAIPGVAMKACKSAMRHGLNVDLKDGLRMEQTAFCMLFGTLDQKEGMRAFLDRRKPVYQNK